MDISETTLVELLGAARLAATESAGALLANRYSSSLNPTTKTSSTDLVTAADLASAHAITQVISHLRPDDTIITEEDDPSSAIRPAPSSIYWIVDPLDGTTNYLYRRPDYCVAVAAIRADSPESALALDGDLLVGVVLAPELNLLYAATATSRAYLNELVITPSDKSQLSAALVNTGFSYDSSNRASQARLLGALLPRVADIRRSGSAALDALAVASARADAYYESSVRPWDIAASTLIALRAGVRIRLAPNLRSGTFAPYIDFVAATPTISKDFEKSLTMARLSPLPPVYPHPSPTHLNHADAPPSPQPPHPPESTPLGPIRVVEPTLRPAESIKDIMSPRAHQDLDVDLLLAQRLSTPLTKDLMSSILQTPLSP